MAKTVNAPRGMRDFLPQDKARREHALSVIRGVYRAHGFDEIEAPMLEDYSRLHAGLGGDNEKLSFSVLKRGLTADDFHAAADEGVERIADLGLRFDLTVPLTRFYATNRAQLPPVFRSIQIAPVWRAERPQKGRYRQFVQADIDIIGEPGLMAEIELLTASSQAFAELGLTDVTIRVNDRRVLFGLLAHCGFEAEVHDRALITIDKLDKIGASGVVEELEELDATAAARMGEVLEAVAPKIAGEGIALTREEIVAALPEGLGGEGVTNLVDLGEALEHAIPSNVTLRFDPTLVRGMGYYTGTIFEVAHPASGSSVGGGGRYDGMVGRFLGQDVPAVGFSIGFERVVDLIELPENAGPASIALVYDTDVPKAQLMSIKRELVAKGHRVRLEKRVKNMKAMLDRIAGEGFHEFANVRPDTLSANDLDVRSQGDR
ncbi:histidine--tRNA ligase [Leucobacter sp. UCMA 4100]|uniref:histidine--tRNA ligase n=1 Tax=Leucobacter sp. UCMA 4100 TaxID=2810534 RepID=UPI0022EB8FF1|nr:histidine--tRNA ligase [Leucobacter sp. UCMA 4100]MDA3147834.1 histidine--tRNA ligase [Leucobacter sp. UCMA 4100]